MIETIEKTINTIDNLIKEQLPESKYQFELFDLKTNTKHFRGYDEPFHWGSIYKLFVIVSLLNKIDTGLISKDYQILLDRNKIGKGAGIFKQIEHLDKLQITDACRFVIATSDALISDTIFELIGLESINQTLTDLGMKNSLVTDNLDNIITSILPAADNYTVDYLYSDKFYQNYSEKLPKILMKNFTTVNDINIGFYNIFNNYLNPATSNLFFEIIQTPNVWSRFSQYSYFSNNISLNGKTGTLGFGIVSNESAVIIDLKNNSVLGYFSVLTNENKKSIYKVFDVLGLIGLEIVKLYEQLETEN